MQEIPNSAVNTCGNIYLDTIEAMDVGDLKHMKNSTNNNTTTIQLLGEVLKQPSDEKKSPPLTPTTHIPVDHNGTPQKKNTFYKSVGTAIQDILTVQVVVDKAREIGNIGTEINMMD